VSTGHNFVELKAEEDRPSETSVSMHNHSLCRNSERSLDQYPLSEPENVIRILQIRRTNQNGANMPPTGGVFKYLASISMSGLRLSNGMWNQRPRDWHNLLSSFNGVIQFYFCYL